MLCKKITALQIQMEVIYQTRTDGKHLQLNGTVARGHCIPVENKNYKNFFIRKQH